MTAILGPTRVSVFEAKAWARSKGATALFLDLAKMYWKLGRAHGGVRPEVAYAQAGKETGFGRFGGVLDSSYKNPCGLKKPGGGGNYDPHAHQRFGTWNAGISAHLDHLALYAGAAGYPRKITHDPRHFAAIRGRATTVEELGGHWAPASSYGQDLADLVSQMKENATPMAKRFLVQAGHVAPREPGFESGTGTVREQEYTSAMQKRVVSLLKADGRFTPIPVPGNIPDGINVDGAVFLHADGSGSAASTGYSFGYPVFPANVRLARLISEEYQKIPGHPPHHADNYTGGLRGYYGYSRTVTGSAEPEVLFEVGFMTNPAEQKWIFAHLSQIAHAIYVAICRFYGFKPRVGIVPKRLGWHVVAIKPDGTIKVVKRTFAPKRLLARLWDDGFRRFVVTRNKSVPIQDTR